MSECIFCKIVAGTAPAVTLYEDEHSLVLLDIFPASVGHTLVISKGHYRDLLEIEDHALAAVAQTSRKVAQALQQLLEPVGLRVGQYNGAPAGQTVFHYHVHLVPVYPGQKPGSHGRDKAKLDELNALAQQLRPLLNP